MIRSPPIRFSGRKWLKPTNIGRFWYFHSDYDRNFRMFHLNSRVDILLFLAFYSFRKTFVLYRSEEWSCLWIWKDFHIAIFHLVSKKMLHLYAQLTSNLLAPFTSVQVNNTLKPELLKHCNIFQEKLHFDPTNKPDFCVFYLQP